MFDDQMANNLNRLSFVFIKKQLTAVSCYGVAFFNHQVNFFNSPLNRFTSEFSGCQVCPENNQLLNGCGGKKDEADKK